jgi:hypothetical protein
MGSGLEDGSSEVFVGEDLAELGEARRCERD